MIEQLWYTSSYYGFGPHKDMVPRVRAASQGLIDGGYTQPEAPDRLVAYDLPRAYPPASPLEDAPICLAYFPIDKADETKWALVNKCYAGPLDAGRPVFFRHLLVASPGEFFENEKEALIHQAIQRWRSAFWRSQEKKEGEELPKGPAILPALKPADLTPGKPPMAEKLKTIKNPQETLAFVIQAYLSLGNSRRLYIAAKPDETAALIWGLTFCFPPALLRALSFSTYEQDVLAPTSTQRIIGTCWVDGSTYDLPPQCYNGTIGWAINRYSGKQSALPENPLVAHFAKYAARCLIDDQKRADLEGFREKVRRRGFSSFSKFIDLYQEKAEVDERPLKKEDITRRFDLGEVDSCLSTAVNRSTTVRESAQDQPWWLHTIKPRLKPWFDEKGQADAAEVTIDVAQEAAEQLVEEMVQRGGRSTPQAEVLTDVLQKCEELLNSSTPWLALLKQTQAKSLAINALPWQMREPLLRRWTAMAVGETQFTDQKGRHQVQRITAEEQKELSKAISPWLQPEWEDLARYFTPPRGEERIAFPDSWQHQIADSAIKNPPKQLEKYNPVVKSLQPLFENRLAAGMGEKQFGPALEFYARLVVARYDTPNRWGLFQRLFAGCRGKPDVEVLVVEKADLTQLEALRALRFSANEDTQRLLVAIVTSSTEMWSDEVKLEVAHLRREARSDTSSASASGFRLLADAIVTQVFADLNQQDFKAGERHLRQMEEVLPALETPKPWLALLQMLNKSSSIGQIPWNVREILLRQWASIARFPNQAASTPQPDWVSPVTTKERGELEAGVRPWLKIDWKDLAAYFQLTLPNNWKQITADWLVEQQPDTLTPLAQEVIWQPETYPFFERSLVQGIGSLRVELVLTFFPKLVTENSDEKVPLIQRLLVAEGITPEVANRLVQVARLSVAQDVEVLVSLSQRGIPDASAQATARRVLVDDFLNRWSEWQPKILRKTIEGLRAQQDASTREALDKLAADLGRALVEMIQREDFSQPDGTSLHKSKHVLQALDWLMPLQSPAPAEAVSFWMALFERLTQQELARRKRQGVQASELPFAERYPWALRRRLLQHWQNLYQFEEERQRMGASIAAWLEIHWEDLEDREDQKGLYSLSLPDPWRLSAVRRLIVHPFAPPQQQLKPEQLALVQAHDGDFEEGMWWLLVKEPQPAGRERALGFLNLLALGGYPALLAMVSRFLAWPEIDGALADALLQAARVSHEDLLALLDQPAQLDRFRHYAPVPQAAQQAIAWYLQTSPLEHVRVERVLAYQAFGQGEDRAAVAIRGAAGVLEQRLVDEIQRRFSSAHERQLLVWLTLLQRVAPATTHPATWQRLLHVSPEQVQTFSREGARQIRLALLQQWQALDEKSVETQIWPWLKVPWEEVQEVLRATLPEPWWKMIIYWKLFDREAQLPPAALSVIEEHLGRFVTCLREVLPAPRDAQDSQQRRNQSDSALLFFSKLVRANPDLKMQVLIPLLHADGSGAGTTPNRRQLDEETITRLLQQANFTSEEELLLLPLATHAAVRTHLLQAFLSFRGSAQENDKMVKALAVKRQEADASQPGVLTEVLRDLIEQATDQLHTGDWEDTPRVTSLLSLLGAIAPVDHFPGPWQALVVVASRRPLPPWSVRERCLRRWAKLPPPLPLQQVRPWLLVTSEQEYKGVQTLPAAWKDAACDLLIEHGPRLLGQFQAEPSEGPATVGIVTSDQQRFAARLKLALLDQAKHAAALDFFRLLALQGYPQTGELLIQFMQQANGDSNLINDLLEAALPEDEREARQVLKQHLELLLACETVPTVLIEQVQTFLDRFSLAMGVDDTEQWDFWVTLLTTYRLQQMRQLPERVQQVMEAWSVIDQFRLEATQPKPLFDAELVGRLGAVLPALPPAARTGQGGTILEQELLLPLAQQIKNQTQLQLTLKALGQPLMRWPQMLAATLAAYVRLFSMQPDLLAEYAREILREATGLQHEGARSDYLRLALEDVLLPGLDDQSRKDLDKLVDAWPEGDLRKAWRNYPKETEKTSGQKNFLGRALDTIGNFTGKTKDTVMNILPASPKTETSLELNEETRHILREIESALKLESEANARLLPTGKLAAAAVAGTIQAPAEEERTEELLEATGETFQCAYGKKKEHSITITENQIVLKEKRGPKVYHRTDILGFQLWEYGRGEDVDIGLFIASQGKWSILEHMKPADGRKVKELLNPAPGKNSF